MARGRWVGLGLTAAAGVVAVAACADESPTAVGSELLGEELRTVEVVYEVGDFLATDTVYNGVGVLNDALFSLAARDFEGELTANALFKITRPFTASYEDEEGESATDSIQAIRGGTLTIVRDTLSDADFPVDVEVVDITESWHPGTVDWSVRADTGDVATPWATVGGTAGSVRATATWSGGDTLRIPIDSAAASVWHDTAGARRGGAVRVATAGKRIAIQALSFRFTVRPRGAEQDTTAGQIFDYVTVASPDAAPPPGELRVGGLPAWRSLVRFKPLADLQVPCETGSTTCFLPLSDVTLNIANLVLEPVPAGGRRTERPIRVEGRAILEGPAGVPLTRLPLSPRFGRMASAIPAAAFGGAAGDEPVRVPITAYVNRLVSPEEDQDPLYWLALVMEAERTTFGYGHFGGVASASPPRLQIVATVPVGRLEQ